MTDATATMDILRADNMDAREDDLRTYAAALCDWKAADANIRENGLIALHPRTGAPFDNPFVSVRDRSARIMRAINIRADRAWTALDGG